MADTPIENQASERIELAPSRRVGAFEFMADHLFDLVIILIREHGDGHDIIRRVELYYAENHKVSCFAFDRASKAYKSDTKKAMQAALAQLYKEVKSRTLAHQKFVTWYFTDHDRELMEMHARDYAEVNKAMLKYLKILRETAQIIPEPEEEEEE